MNTDNELVVAPKKFYKRWWFLALASITALFVIIIAAALIDASNDPKPAVQAVDSMNINVTSQIVKKVDGKYRYFFDIRNNDTKDFSGKVKVNLHSKDNTLGTETFTTADSISPNTGSSQFIEINTAPEAVHGEFGIIRFTYEVLVDGTVVKSGEGNISTELEDLSN